jgi:hypothetical protein
MAFSSPNIPPEILGTLLNLVALTFSAPDWKRIGGDRY